MQISLSEFEQEKLVFDLSLKNGKCENITRDDVENIYNELIALPIMGSSIKKHFDTEVRTAGKANKKNNACTVALPLRNYAGSMCVINF